MNTVDGDEVYTSFQIKGDENATKLFEFMSKSGITTNVEWTRTKVGLENSENNFVGTSHSPNYTIDGARLLLEGYTILYHVHNHPKNNPPAPADVYIRNEIKKKFPNAIDQLYRNGTYEDIPSRFD